MIDTSKAILTEENTHIVDSCEVKSKEEIMDYLTQLRGENFAGNVYKSKKYGIVSGRMACSQSFLWTSCVPQPNPRCRFGTASKLVARDVLPRGEFLLFLVNMVCRDVACYVSTAII